MATTAPLIICEHCDCVYEKVTLAKRQKTLCITLRRGAAAL